MKLKFGLENMEWRKMGRCTFILAQNDFWSKIGFGEKVESKVGLVQNWFGTQTLGLGVGLVVRNWFGSKVYGFKNGFGSKMSR